MSWIKTKIKEGLLCLVAIVVGLALFEIGLRLFDFGYGNAPIENSTQFHHEHPKKYHFRVHSPSGEYGNHMVTYDENGWRISDGDSPGFRNDKKILLLGDSFTEAVQVPWKSSFAGILQENAEVINAGVTSYSPLIYLVQLKSILSKLKPTDVVMQVYTNDFADDVTYLEKSDTKDLKTIASVKGDDGLGLATLLRVSYVARLIRKIQLDIGYRISRPIEDLSESFYNPKFDDDSITIKAILEANKIVTSNGANFYVMIIPNKSLAINESCCASDVTNKNFVNIMKKNNVNVVDLGVEFEKYSDQKSLFFPSDIHLTSSGHGLVAKKLKTLLFKN